MHSISLLPYAALGAFFLSGSAVAAPAQTSSAQTSSAWDGTGRVQVVLDGEFAGCANGNGNWRPNKHVEGCPIFTAKSQDNGTFTWGSEGALGGWVPCHMYDEWEVLLCQAPIDGQLSSFTHDGDLLVNPVNGGTNWYTGVKPVGVKHVEYINVNEDKYTIQLQWIPASESN